MFVNFLKSNFFIVGMATGVLSLSISMYAWGRHDARAACRAQVSELRETYAEALLKAERNYTAALQQHAENYQARLQAAREADKNLFAAANQARIEANQHKKEIPHVIQNDADCSVLGTLGLQHYQKSLGY